MALNFEGYVIVSADGMLADSRHMMPDELKFEADKKFFEAGLDRADLIVHGGRSHEGQKNSDRRKRLVLTRKVASLAADTDIPKATLWNPVGASFDQACEFTGVTHGTVAVIGGPDVFEMFMDRYDTFWLSVAASVRLPGGQGCFPGVPAQTPQQVLASHGMHAGPAQMLDPANEVTVTPWRRLRS